MKIIPSLALMSLLSAYAVASDHKVIDIQDEKVYANTAIVNLSKCPELTDIGIISDVVEQEGVAEISTISHQNGKSEERIKKGKFKIGTKNDVSACMEKDNQIKVLFMKTEYSMTHPK